MKGALCGVGIVFALAAGIGCGSPDQELGQQATGPTPALQPVPTLAPTPTPIPPATPTPMPAPPTPDLTPDPNPFVEENAPRAVLREAVARTFNANGFHFLLQMRLMPEARGLSLEVPIESEGDYQPPDRTRAIVNVQIRGTDLSFREIAFEDVKYRTDPSTGEWEVTPSPMTPAGEPTDFLMIEPGILREIEVTGLEDIAGIPAYHIRATAPAGAIGRSPGPVQLEFWTGAADLVIRRVAATGLITWEQVDVLLDPAAGGVAPMSMRMRLSGFGRPVTIEAPEVAASHG